MRAEIRTLNLLKENSSSTYWATANVTLSLTTTKPRSGHYRSTTTRRRSRRPWWSPKSWRSRSTTRRRSRRSRRGRKVCRPRFDPRRVRPRRDPSPWRPRSGLGLIRRPGGRRWERRLAPRGSCRQAGSRSCCCTRSMTETSWTIERCLFIAKQNYIIKL